MAGCHKNSMSIYSEISQYSISIWCKYKYLQAIKFFTLMIVIGYLNVSATFRFWGNHNISDFT